MRKSVKLNLSVSALLAVTLFAGAAKADDAVVKQQFEAAKALFAQREDQSKNDAAIAALNGLDAQAQDAGLKYDILVLASHAQYWKAGHQPTDALKMAEYQKGMDKAKAAKAINDDYAEAYYYYAINLGKWALANGVIASLSHKGELVANAEGAQQRDTRDGQPGETIDGYGPDRTLGRLYFKLPGFAGGSHDKSIKHLEICYGKAKDLALNVVYYAETLYDGSATEKAQAKQILDTMLAQDPSSYNVNRTPETKEEFNDARVLRHQMGN